MNAPDPITRLNAALEGRYRIEFGLGEGGMATVYLADDVKHERKVALKVLKPELAAVVGAERFLAEIKTTANLQHPHILPLFDSGEADSFLFYVMPYVEGETLRDRLQRENELPVDEAVRIAKDVAEALHSAHEQGVIHRDIKPANILMSKGRPLVADFGIALAVSGAGRGRLTETGLSMGTPYYMSPEQAAGDRDVGARSDVYALGCVLYEMLLGKPPYTGSTAQAVLAQVLTETPKAPTSVRAAVPPNVDAAVLKSLEKLPADRFTTAAEFSKALADPGFRHGVAGAATADAGSGPWKHIALGLGLTAVLAIAGLTALLLSDDASPPVARYSVGLPSSQQVSAGFGSNVTISPDGSAIVYVGPTEDLYGQQLWLRQRDQLLPEVVAGTEDAISPVFSPDGSRVAFAVGGALRITSLAGEPPLEILSDRNLGARPSGLAWSEDGYLYYAKEPELWRVRETGGEPELAVPFEPDEGDVMHRWPGALPGGRGVLFTIADGGPSRNLEASTIAVLDAESGERRTLLSGVFARYARSGHIVYVSPDGTLLAVPFDLGSLAVTGDPVALPGTARVGLDGIHLAVSTQGTLVYLAGVSEERVRPVWVSREGLAQVIDPDWSGRMYFPSLSPDGSRVAIDMLTEANDVWIKQLDTGPQLRLTREGGGARAVWTPDGNAVSFFSVRGGNEDVWTRRADGSAPAELTFDGVAGVHEALWSPNGEWLVYRTPAGGGIYAVRPGDDDEPVTLVETDADELSPTLSPDGRFMAFMSNETGRHEVYLVPFPRTADARWAVSTDGGRSPRWSPAGDEIFFIDATDNMVSVPVETEPTFTFGSPRVLFSVADYAVEIFYHAPYDVTPDGQRFLMLAPAGSGENQLVVVQGFFEILREQVGRQE